MSRHPSQNDRLLAALRGSRGFGVRGIDFLAPDVLDGGRPITRVASRMTDLRKAGHDIETRMEPASQGGERVARYVLHDPPRSPAQVAPEAAPRPYRPSPGDSLELRAFRRHREQVDAARQAGDPPDGPPPPSLFDGEDAS